MGSNHSSNYATDTIARDFVHVYTSSSIKQGPRRVAKPIRKRQAPTPTKISSQNRLKVPVTERRVDKISTADSDFKMISLADMELQCDGEKCQLVPSRAYKRKRNSTASSTGSTSSRRSSSKASPKKNFKQLSPRLGRLASSNSKQTDRSSVLSNIVEISVDIDEDLSGQYHTLAEVAEIEYNLYTPYNSL